ncbi:hypothetical protein BSPWISOXPB_10025 [uncultured Gammaproteobacteria bacterium]|nr:hypothetical protein BSPWISOXPB_10025 [uncultured Gammaproteobacteria bacterium]
MPELAAAVASWAARAVVLAARLDAARAYWFDSIFCLLVDH